MGHSEEETRIISRKRRLLYKAIKEGHIIRGTICSKCGSNRTIEGHHPDLMNKPFSVIWLCKKCHMKTHGMVLFEEKTNYSECVSCGKKKTASTSLRCGRCGNLHYQLNQLEDAARA